MDGDKINNMKKKLTIYLKNEKINIDKIIKDAESLENCLDYIRTQNKEKEYLELTIIYLEKYDKQIYKIFAHIDNNIKYILEYKFENSRDQDFIKQCKKFVFFLSKIFGKGYIQNLNNKEYSNNLINLIPIILFFLSNEFSQMKKIENKIYVLLNIINGIKTINNLKDNNNPYLLDCLNEFIYCIFNKIFENENIIEIILLLTENIEYFILNQKNRNLKLKKLNLILLFLIYKFSDLQNLEIKQKIKDLINDKTKKNEIEIYIKLSSKIKDIIINLFLNLSLNLNQILLKIIFGDFSSSINSEEDNNNCSNFLLYRNFIIFSSVNYNNFFFKNDYEKNIKESKILFYQFLQNENFLNKYNIKELILTGILDIFSDDLYNKFLNEKFQISFIISKFKDLIYDKNSYLKEKYYSYLLTFLFNIIENNNYYNEIKNSWNDILDILLFISKNNLNKNLLNELISIEKLIFENILNNNNNLNLDNDKIIKLFELIPINSLIIFGYIFDYKISKLNDNFDNDINNLINNFLIIKDIEYQSSFIFLILDKIKKELKKNKNKKKIIFEKIFCQNFEKFIDNIFIQKKYLEHFLFYLLKIIINMNFSEYNLSKIINTLFLDKYKKYNCMIQSILYDIFWILNYNFQKDKMKLLLNIYLEEDKFNLIFEKILLKINITDDGLVFIKNKKNLINKLKISPIPILNIKNNKNSNFIFFDIQSIFDKYLSKNMNNINNDFLKIISKQIKNKFSLNQNSISKIYNIITNQIIYTSKLNLENLLNIYFNLNYYFSWSKINSFSYFNNLEEKKDSLLEILLNNIENINLNYHLNLIISIYQFYINSLYENAIKESFCLYLEQFIDFLINIFHVNKNDYLILINILNSFSILKEIIINYDALFYKSVLIISLICFPENESYFIKEFLNKYNIKLPEKEKENYRNKKNTIESINNDQIIYTKNFGIHLLLYYLSHSKVKNELIKIFQQFPNNNSISETNFNKLFILQNDLNIIKKDNISLNKIKDILTKMKEKIYYVLYKNNLLISYPESENLIILFIINNYYNFQYLIEISKSSFQSLTKEDQIIELTSILNKKKNRQINFKTNCKNYNPNRTIIKNKLSKYLLQYIINIGYNKILNEIKEITPQDFSSLYYLLSEFSIPDFNINIIYNPPSLNLNINTDMIYNNKKEKFSKEFLNFINKFGDIEIDKNSKEIKIIFEENNKIISLSLYDILTKKEIEKLKSSIKLEIIFMDYPNQHINEFLNNFNYYSKVYVFIFPKDENFYNVKIRYRNISNLKKELKIPQNASNDEENLKLLKIKQNYKYIEEYIKEFLDEYLFKDIIINFNLKSGIRFFKNLIFFLSSKIDYISKITNNQKFIPIEEQKINKIKTILNK